MIDGKRVHPRTHTDWPADSYMQVDIFSQYFKGLIKDITPYGLFFQPQQAFFGKVPISSQRYLSMFQVGDKVNVKSGKLRTRATVVWKGESKEHGCSGVGLKFLEE